jgi:hypothetical protein
MAEGGGIASWEVGTSCEALCHAQFARDFEVGFLAFGPMTNASISLLKNGINSSPLKIKMPISFSPYTGGVRLFLFDPIL